MMSLIRRSRGHVSVLGGVLLALASVPAASAQASTGPSPALTSARSSALFLSLDGAVPFGGIRGRLPGVAAAPAGAQVSIEFTALDGVFCTSASNCWAVGLRQSSGGHGGLNQMLHWNGKAWRNFPVPNPGGTAVGDLNELFAVRCLNARDCWAVGLDSRGGAVLLNQALHWNGRKWSKVPAPNPGGSRDGDLSELYDVTCTSAASCWAVGDFGTTLIGPNQKLRSQALHWNGARWSKVSTPGPGGAGAGHLTSLFAVRCSSARDCNAVGDYGTTSASSDVMRNQAVHWNGKRWSEVRAPNPGGTSSGSFSMLDALACGSPTSCWGAGSYGTHEPTATSLNDILHWNGKKWTRSTAPSPGGTSPGDTSELIGATCSSSRNCWAVGTYGNSVAALVNEALHWNGTKWSAVGTPDPGGTAAGDLNVLAAVRCTSSSNCWAVGVQHAMSGGFRDEILHWNGTKWSVR